MPQKTKKILWQFRLNHSIYQILCYFLLSMQLLQTILCNQILEYEKEEKYLCCFYFFSLLFCCFLYLVFKVYTLFLCGKKDYLVLQTFLLHLFPAKSRLHSAVKSKELLLKKYKISNSDNKQMCKCLILVIVTCYRRN